MVPGLDEKGIPAADSQVLVRILVSPGQFQQHWVWPFDGVEYSLGVDERGTVQYLATSSTEVSTPEGVIVGQTFAELEMVEGVRVVEWPGWGYVAELPSGWKAALFLGSSMTDWEPEPTDRVAILFRGTSAGYGARLPENEESPGQ